MSRTITLFLLLWLLAGDAGLGQAAHTACFGVERGEWPTDGPDAAAGSTQSAPPGMTPPNVLTGSEPLFVFAAIGDAHIVDDRMVPGFDNRGYLTAGSIAKELLMNYVNDINNHNPRVDFTIVLGDISDKGKSWELRKAKEILGNLTSPYYPVVGNHDNFQDDDKAAWKAAFGYDSTHYVFEYRGFKFIIIDPTLNPYDPPDHIVRFDESTINWVRSELIKDPQEPTFLVNHYNLLTECWNAQFQTFAEVGQKCLTAKGRSATEYQVSTRTVHPGDSEPAQYYRVWDGGEELRTVLENYGNVVASINGHVHANRIENLNGITYVSVGATLVGRPSVRYFCVYPGRVEVDYQYISDRTLFDHVSNMCPNCSQCSSPGSVCSFIDGQVSDRRSTIVF
jgi:calcineurin-like phosphoesterase family protein